VAVLDARIFERLARLAERRRQIVRPGADVAALRSVAYASGGELLSNPMVPEAAPVLLWDRSRRCLSPWLLDFLGEGHFREVTPSETWQPMVQLSMLGMCRRCPPCLRFRSWLWSTRAAIECSVANRTWFCTLTYRPSVFLLRSYQAEQRYGAGWSSLSHEERLSLVLAECGRDLRLFMVQLRADARRDAAAALGVAKRNAPSATGIRQMSVVEFHQSGVPHFHALIHERDPLLPVRKRLLVDAWRHGFTKFNLVDESDGAPRYLSKYLSKDAVSRVRASPRYGQVEGLPEALEPLPKF